MPARQYRNPPIEEAICEFKFEATPPETTLDLSIPGKLQSHPDLRDEYAGQARLQNMQTIVSSDQKRSVSVQNALYRIQLPNSDGKRLLLIGANTFAVSVLKPYEGWNQFKPRIQQALLAYFSVVAPHPVTRIGVRYINRIVVPTPAAVAADYFDDVLPSHKTLSGTLINFVYRSEYKIPGAKAIINQASLRPVDPATTEFLLDIDLVREDIALSDASEIMLAVDELHSLEGAAFESLITDNARKLFDANESSTSIPHL